MTFASKGSKSDIDNDECRTWFPPLIDDAGNILPSAEKEDRQRQALEQKRRNEVVGQTIQRPKKLKPMTAKQLSDLSDSAYQDGYAAGFKQGEEDGTQKGHQAGLKQGLDESRSQAEKQRQQLLQLIDGLLTPFDQQTKQYEKMLLDTIVTLTKSVTQRELSSNSSEVEHFVREALLALPSGSDNIAIHVHPDDLALLSDFYVERMNDWQLVSDPRITQGGCKVETKQSLVDFSVESRLQDLCKQFIDGKLIGASDHDDISNHDITSSNLSEKTQITSAKENHKSTSIPENIIKESSASELSDEIHDAENPSSHQANASSETVSSPESIREDKDNLVADQQAEEKPNTDNLGAESSESQEVKDQQDDEGKDE